jgi:hypothetical protein
VSKRVPRERAPPSAAAVVDDDTNRADSDREGVETMLRQGMGRRFRKEGAVKRGADERGGGRLGARRVFCGAAWRGARPAAPARRGAGSAAAVRLVTGLAAAARRGSELAARAALRATRWRRAALSRAPASASPARSNVATWGFARRGGKEGDDGADGGDSDLGEKRCARRMPVQGEGRQLSSGDAIPFPPLNERDHVAAAGGVCWKRGSRESAAWGSDSSTSSDDGEYIPEGGGGAESEGSNDGDGEWDDTPRTCPPTRPTEPPGFIQVTLLGPDADWEAKIRRIVGVIAGRITARHA